MSAQTMTAAPDGPTLQKARTAYLKSREELQVLADEFRDATQRHDTAHAQTITRQLQAARMAHNAAKRAFLKHRETSLSERISIAVIHLENLQRDLNAVRNDLLKVSQ